MVKYRWSVLRTTDKSLWDATNFNEKPTLTEMQEAVGGYIENIPKGWLAKGVRTVYVNEEGMIYNLPVNHIASKLLNTGQVLLGDVVVQWREDMGLGEYGIVNVASL